VAHGNEWTVYDLSSVKLVMWRVPSD
jgi:hypothetical protein